MVNNSNTNHTLHHCSGSSNLIVTNEEYMSFLLNKRPELCKFEAGKGSGPYDYEVKVFLNEVNDEDFDEWIYKCINTPSKIRTVLTELGGIFNSTSRRWSLEKLVSGWNHIYNVYNHCRNTLRDLFPEPTPLNKYLSFLLNTSYVRTQMITAAGKQVGPCSFYGCDIYIPKITHSNYHQYIYGNINTHDKVLNALSELCFFYNKENKQWELNLSYNNYTLIKNFILSKD